MTDHNGDRTRRPVAFVTHTREYRRMEVLTALACQGYSITERPHDLDTEQLLVQLVPEVVLLAVDPRQEHDLGVIGQVARSCRAALIALLPGPHADGIAYALDAGADICIRDAECGEVLGAQLNAIARKRGHFSFGAFEGAPRTITVRDVELDFDRRQAMRGEEVIPLTPNEFKILAYLARNAGKVISNAEILRAVEDRAYTDREKRKDLKTYILRIRRKIEFDSAESDYIVNVRGVGYMVERRGFESAQR